jgi:hypothetical protein
MKKSIKRSIPFLMNWIDSVVLFLSSGTPHVLSISAINLSQIPSHLFVIDAARSADNTDSVA